MAIVKKTIMVPWDFSPVSDLAFQHALLLKRGFVDLTLVHIVDKEIYIKPKKDEIEKIAEEYASKYNIEKPNVVVKKGNIYKHLSALTIEINALLAVMGVHNIHNKRVLKVVLGSKVPFVLVQTPPKRQVYHELVVPFDEDRRNRITLNWVINLAKYYNVNVDIIKPFISNNVRNEKMRNQMFFVKKNLDVKGIIFGIRTAKREVLFQDAIFHFSEEIDSDMIIIMSHNFKNYIKGMKEYKPTIMVINPKLAKLGGFN
jgi:hypothetical protein